MEYRIRLKDCVGDYVCVVGGPLPLDILLIGHFPEHIEGFLERTLLAQTTKPNSH